MFNVINQNLFSEVLVKWIIFRIGETQQFEGLQNLWELVFLVWNSFKNQSFSLYTLYLRFNLRGLSICWFFIAFLSSAKVNLGKFCFFLSPQLQNYFSYFYHQYTINFSKGDFILLLNQDFWYGCNRLEEEEDRLQKFLFLNVLLQYKLNTCLSSVKSHSVWPRWLYRWLYRWLSC